MKLKKYLVAELYRKSLTDINCGLWSRPCGKCILGTLSNPWDSSPASDFNYSFLVLTKHTGVWCPVLALSACFPLGLKLLSLLAPFYSSCCTLLYPTHFSLSNSFFPLTYNNMTSEFLTRVLVAVLMDVSGQFHSFELDE